MTKSKAIGILAGILTGAASYTYTGVAHAEGPGYGSAAALLGFGFATSSPAGASSWNPAGLGFGVRGGYTLPMNVYVGGTFVYHLGSSEGDVTFSSLYFGVEGGYELEAGPVMVRPYLGVGDVIGKASGSACGPLAGCLDVSASNGAFGLWPGVTVLYPIDNFFVGGDARFVIATGDNSNFSSLAIFATGGLKF